MRADPMGFVAVFDRCAARMAGRPGDVQNPWRRIPADEREALAWVAAISAQGGGFGRACQRVWLRPGEVEFVGWGQELLGEPCQPALPPLALAALRGLASTVQALLAAGADPAWAFDPWRHGGHGEPGERVGALELASGWAFGGEPCEACAGLLRSALEAREIALAAPPRGRAGSSERDPARI